MDLQWHQKIKLDNTHLYNKLNKVLMSVQTYNEIMPYVV